MATKSTIYFRVRVRELFPPDDPVVPSLLRLMAAVNDLRTLQKLWLFAESRAGRTPSENEIIEAEHIYLFRLTCATVYEAGIAFRDFRKALADSQALGNIDRMPDRAREAFGALDRLFREDFEALPWGKRLVQLRNSAFHYEDPRVFRAELQNHDELGELIIGEIVGVSRYLLADDLQVQITMRPLGLDNKDNVRALSQMVSEMMRYFGHLVDGMVVFYLRLHEGAVAGRREDSVDPEHLWKIAY